MAQRPGHEHRGTARSVEEHAAEVGRLLAPLLTRPSETVRLDDALDRVLSYDITSPVDLPLFRNSQMDGFAVDAVSVAAVPVTLPVVGTVAAGPAEPAPHVPGTAVRIMTGAVIPDGADAVVPVEDTEVIDGKVTVSRPRDRGDYVRERGSDVRTGMLLLTAGTLLEPRHLGVLAAVGLGSVAVRTRPRVAVITTGAELVDAGTTPAPGQIYDSNGAALSASLRANGAEVAVVDRSSDEPDAFRAALRRAVARTELVITSGGVSMGDYEVVKDVLTELGARFGPVAMQPGGPQGLALVDEIPVLTFPGNPVSTMVSFEVFLRPLLRRAVGLPAVPTEDAVLGHAVTSIAGKRQFLRGRRTDTGVEVVSGPGSHLVAAFAWADVLIDVPAAVTSLAAGDRVKVWPL
ncbi:gephyrin-like molybdotransferase Glp [Rhodococcus sp. TAF43]|uniref:molybdopterin molybdotransferase MoeA n=1 Tax=unclassified Rhodococcus (in: high G+C Gram-positive bacteria) TaxID=192944 RepID=UPI001583AF3A|nr:gephyrin-like molybdotransferase Glp [Rhodococcus sp. W8901]QKT12430.1 molybdopterin molybdotransferase MoeA [Rhodococcus sp. W8901]